MTERHVVTGAFSFTGGFIARALLARGVEVATLTRREAPDHPLAKRVTTLPLQFTDPDLLTKNLSGAEVLYNTYWVRFNYGQVSFDRAIANTRILLAAARQAGVRKFVHISVSNPSEDSPLAYYRGKATLERLVKESGLPYAIIRPTLIYGDYDILINNIAYFLRHFPIFAVPGRGDYQVQPVSGEDVAQLAIEAGASRDDRIQDAAGPEIYRFDEFVQCLRRAVGSRTAVAHLPYSVTLACSKVLGWMMNDIVLNGQEIQGLMAGLLVTQGAATGSMRFSEWLSVHAKTVGKEYVSELIRNYR